ncbi:UNVERIFIED_CONTAM: hypothetical protein PYX00_000645 [Menopon gallinae]|uniref:UBX domain-containing protein n=1 Tax=Menopon gallinae TaxID=328185 RepID=A0AAW2IA10_9NEOP
MADKLKKFFKNKKLDTSFKRAGPGYKLSESSSSSSGNSTQSNDYQPPRNRAGLTHETQQAAAAALARLEGKKKDTSVNKSFSAIQAQVRRELASEREKKSANAYQNSTTHKRDVVEIESPSVLAARDIYFKCPLIGPQILTKEEWNRKIKEFLYEQLQEEKGLTACLILHSLNKNPEKIKACVEILIRYFENILENPNEEKYRKIRLSNKVFVEKVMPMEGALQVLEAAGFEIIKLPHADGDEDFLVFPEEKLAEAHETLDILIDALRNAEPITLELDRNMQVLLPSEAKERSELPAIFFNLTVEEIRREQALRTEAVERSQMLRTKAMRERDEIHEVRKYRFGVIRIRFPEEVLLQGTFGVHEKFSSVIEFVREALRDETISFSLNTPTGQEITDENATLLELKLIPASVLNFRAQSAGKCFLKPEVMALVQTLS